MAHYVDSTRRIRGADIWVTEVFVFREAWVRNPIDVPIMFGPRCTGSTSHRARI